MKFIESNLRSFLPARLLAGFSMLGVYRRWSSAS
jgi:hypothetical protein